MLNSPRLCRLPQWLRALVPALGLEAAFVTLFRLGNLELHVVETIAIALGSGIVYVIALYLLEHSPDSRRAFWLILLASVFFRLTLAPLRPTLSDDIFRYRFDGQVQALGYSPYLVRPDLPRFAALAVHSIRSIPGQGIRSVYPPLSELVFRAAWRLFPGPVAFKWPFLLADFLVLLALAWRARRSRIRNYQLALYGWNPLVVVEFAASGHNDALALAAAVGATLLIIGPRRVVSTLLLAAGVLAKAFPAVLVPLWLVRLGWPRRGWTAVLAGCGLAAVCVWPYRSAARVVATTLRQYQSSFRDNNASIYLILQHITHSSRLPLGLGVGVVAGLALWVAARRLDPVRAAILLFGTILLVSPNAYPWYFTWIVPFLALAGTSRYLAPWLMLTILQFLSYEVLIGYGALGVWHFRPLFLWLTYGPFYAWLLWIAFTASPPAARPLGKRIPASAIPPAPAGAASL
ncbi:MAG TPA: glycosyltransferase 87 family protein [Patescibacteria group bacterium]|nr:glycosyltransferase 87 family protein [Patescibacteria group bacterium]